LVFFYWLDEMNNSGMNKSGRGACPRCIWS
jgi:hypothetical protein